MLKLLLIFGITAYILYKVGSFLFKVGAASQQFRESQGNINPNGTGQAKKKKPKISGEYIDYEEVK